MLVITYRYYDKAKNIFAYLVFCSFALRFSLWRKQTKKQSQAIYYRFCGKMLYDQTDTHKFYLFQANEKQWLIHPNQIYLFPIFVLFGLSPKILCLAKLYLHSFNLSIQLSFSNCSQVTRKLHLIECDKIEKELPATSCWNQNSLANFQLVCENTHQTNNNRIAHF